MEELTHLQQIALYGFLLAIVFGAVAAKTNFCTMGAVSDIVNIGSRGRMSAWLFAIGVAMIGTTYLRTNGYIDLDSTMYLASNFTYLSYALGGFLFGIGMTLAAGCGQRNLVRIGGGNLKSVVVVLIFGITAYMTMRGLFAYIRIDYLAKPVIDLEAAGMAGQGFDHAIATIFGLTHDAALQMIVALVLGLGCIIYAVKHEEFRTSFDNILAGVVIGGLVILAWYITGHLGQDDFDPIAPAGLTFIGPTGNTISYLMTFTGSEIDFAIAVTFGMILGSFLYAIASGTFRVETFSNKSEMISNMGGAVLMGFGGVLSLGCTIGQGVTGLSTLAFGSALVLGMIIFGSALTMKVQYHMMDECTFGTAVKNGLNELINPFYKEA